MLSMYDLFDLSAIYKAIRSNPKYSKNDIILEKVLVVLRDESPQYQFNKLRIEIAKVGDLDYEMYRFAFTENVHTYFSTLLKDQEVLNLFICCTEKMLNLFRRHSYEQTKDLADCLHNLPIYVAENKLKIPKKFWRLEAEEYRKKWDKNFTFRKLGKQCIYSDSLYKDRLSSIDT